MKGFKYIVRTAIYIFIWHYFISILPVAYAEESLGSAIDCTDVSVDYLEDPRLTREERLRLMDKAFYLSLNKFELCQEANKMAAAAASGGGANGGDSGNGGGTKGGSGELAEETEGTSSVESVASSTMSGTEPPREGSAAEGGEAKTSDALQGSQDRAESGSKKDGNSKMSNGKRPEDIPSAKNDDALAAQIRYAAENETDPVKSKQLWNEYRKYKGLATK